MKNKTVVKVIGLLIFISIAGYFSIKYSTEKAALEIDKEPKILSVIVAFKVEDGEDQYLGDYTCAADGTHDGGEYCRLKTMNDCIKEAGKEGGKWRAGGLLPERLEPGETVHAYYEECDELAVVWAFVLTDHYVRLYE